MSGKQLKTQLIVLVLFFTCISCKIQSRKFEPVPDTLRVGNGAEPADLDPHLVSGVTEHVILAALFEGLVNLEPETLKPIPGVASHWEVSPDGKTYTFYLRPDAKWSNGDPVLANDFVYAWQRILTPTLGAEYAHMLHCIENAREFNEGKLNDFTKVGVSAIDPYTLRVTLRYPTPTFLSMHIHFTYFPVHRPTIEKFGRLDERGTLWTRPGNLVSNGAFCLEKWEPDRIIVVRKNPFYWNKDTIRLQEIHFYPIDNLKTEELLFRVGRLDLTSTVPLAKVDLYQKKTPHLIKISPYLGTYFYRINTTKPPFNDSRVRQALSLAINREDLVKNVIRAGRKPATSLTPPYFIDYHPPALTQFEPSKAKKLLAEAGFPDGSQFPPFEILFNTSEDHRQIAEAIQAMWQENLGIRANLRNQDWKVYLNSLSTLDYDVARSAWIGDTLDPINFLECFTSGNGNNRTGFCSTEYDLLIEKARSAANPEERYNLLYQAEELLLIESPIIPIYFYTRVYLQAPYVEGILPNLLGYIDFKNVYIDPSNRRD